jgi:hypothetical protein
LASIDGSSPLVAIFLVAFWASGGFGMVTVKTPFFTLACTLSGTFHAPERAAQRTQA